MKKKKNANKKIRVAVWSKIVTLILNLCEQKCERCDHSNTFKGLGRISIFVLDGNKTNIDPSNYFALCQRCQASFHNLLFDNQQNRYSYTNLNLSKIPWFKKAIERRKIAKLDFTSHS